MVTDMSLMSAKWVFADRRQMEKLGLLIADGNSTLAKLPMLRP
jgi:hypothetical protein